MLSGIKLLAGFAVLVALACGCAGKPIKVDSPEFMQTYAPSKTFNTSKDKCFAAVKAALTSQEYKIKHEDMAKGVLLTKKRKFTVNATERNLGDNKAQHFQLEHSSQVALVLKGNDSTCTVTIKKMKLWNGVEEMKEVLKPGAEWTKTHIVDSLYSEIESELAASDS